MVSQTNKPTIRSIRLDGARHRLVMSAPEPSFNDLGERIAQTVLADLTFDGVAATPSSVGLEYRRRRPPTLAKIPEGACGTRSETRIAGAGG